MAIRRAVHRLLLLAALGSSAAVVYSVWSGRGSADGTLQTLFVLTPARGAGFAVFLACALFFPAFAALVLVPMSWSRVAVRTGAFARYFCLFSGALHAGAAWLGPESPSRLLALSAGVFIAAGLSAPPSVAGDLPPPAVADRAHQRLGWLLTVSGLGFGGWVVAHLVALDDVSSVWAKKDGDTLFGAVLLPPMVAMAMLLNRRWRTARKRAQGRLWVRVMCLASAAGIARTLTTGWSLPVWVTCLTALVFVIAAAFPWAEPGESEAPATAPTLAEP